MPERNSDFDPASFGYRAFISYSRRDTEFVDDLYKRLTRYRAPNSLQSAQAKYGRPPKSLRVFLDRMSIEAGGTVPESIKQKLRDSAFLIVICSKDAVDSFWVNEEVKYFLSIASADRILPILIRDSADTQISEIMPKPLLDLEDATPMGADLLLDGGMVSVRDKIIGGLIGLAQDRVARAQEIADRRALRRRSLALASISILFVLSTLAGIAAWHARNTALLAESRSLSRAATEVTVEEWQPDLGMLLALQALPKRQSKWPILERPFEPQAAVALASSLFWQGERNVIGTPSSDIVYSAPSVSVDRDGSRWLYAYDRKLEIWDSAAQLRLTEFQLDDTFGSIESAQFSLVDDVVAIVADPEHYLFISASTGDILAQGQTDPSAYGDMVLSPTRQESVLFRGGADLWIVDAQTGTIKTSLQGHTRQVQKAAFDATGDRIASLAGDRSIRVWDRASGAEVSRLETDAHMGFRDFLFAPDGQTIIAVTDDAVQKFNVAEARLIQEEKRSRRYFLFGTLAASADGTMFAVSEGADIAIRNWSDLSERQRLEGHRETISHLSFSADDQMLASTSIDETARIWTVRSGAEIAQYVHPDRPFADIRFTKAGIVAAGRDTAAYFWKRPPTMPVSSLSGHEDAVPSISYSPDGSKLVSASADFTVKIWDTETGELAVPIGGARSHGWIVLDALFGPSGAKVLSVGEDQNAIMWDAETGEELWAIGADDTIRGGAFSPDGALIAVASADNSIGLIQAETGALIFQADAHDGGARGVMFAPERAEFMTYGADGSVKIWDIAAARERLTLEAFDLGVATASYSPDGRYIVAATGGGGEGQATVFDALSGNIIARLYPHNGAVRQAIFTDDGQRVLTASADGYARLWDIESETVITSVSSDQRDLSDVDISPDGKRFVTVSYAPDGPAAILWDLETGQRIADYYGQEGSILDVEFAPFRTDEPMRFATAGFDGLIEIWEAPRPLELASLQARACAVLQTRERVLSAQEAVRFGLDWPAPDRCPAER